MLYVQYLYHTFDLYNETVLNELEETLSIGFTKITEPFPVVVEAVDIQYLAMYYLPAPAEETSVRIGFIWPPTAAV